MKRMSARTLPPALLLPLLFCLFAAPSAAANRFAAAGQARPNFLFLFSDDQTFRTLGRLGELEVKTPNLDRLAQRGMRFTHCFNQGGWSGAVCIPSRTMLNTGRTLWNSRGPNNKGLAPDAALWGETLGRAGYATFMAGKWHIPAEALKRSFKTLGPLTGGFLPSTPNDGAAYHRPAPGNPWTPDDPQWKGHWLEVDGQTVHSSVRIADAAIDFLRKNATQSANPFFMYVAFNAPHDPRQSPREFLNLYPPATLQLPPNFLPKHPFLIDATFDGRDESLAPYPRTPEVIRVHLQEYYALITHLDAQIGRLLDALEASGRAANTVIIFTSDQGLAVGQHGLMGKQNLYDHSLRMPFILAGPGIPAGQRNDALFNMQSLFATTCEMAGVPVPGAVQFPSIVPLVTGAKPQLHDALYAAFLDRQRAVRTAQWKLIRSPQEGQVQLFDVERDPWEMHNLATDPNHAATLAMLDARLRALMREMNDPMPAEQLFAAAAKTAGPTTKAFKKVADEMDTAMQANNAAVQSAPLSFPKGKGLRILMTGHSWVAPGKITLPEIAQAAGYQDHVQRDHTSGGASGSANSIWLNEHGQDKNKPTRVILLPAIPTGQWDVMTWGMYTNDTPHDYTQWMDLGLKYNPAMVFYIQDGWPTPRMGAKGTPPDKMLEALQEMYVNTMMPMFQGNYDTLNRSYPGKVHVIPAGAAVVEMLRHYFAGELPGFDCMAEINGGKRGIYSPDSFHLSRTSGIGWLVGYCYYGMLYKKSPELILNFHPKGVDATVDRFMRQAAWHAITHYSFSGLTDENSNGLADQIARQGSSAIR